MNRQNYRQAIRAGVGFCFLLLATTNCGRSENRDRDKSLPDTPIIIFSIDTLRADHLGSYGYPRDSSPRIDSFARSGVSFHEAFAQAPTTAPSHMSIFTSLYPPAHRIKNTYRTGEVLNAEIVTLPEFLQENGYLTVGLTGGIQVREESGFGRGFDYFGYDFYEWEDWNGEMRPTLENLTPIKNSIRKWIQKSRQSGQPLFLFLHHFICHDPYLKGPDEYRQKFLDRPVAGLPRSVDDLDLSAGHIKDQFFENADPRNPAHIQHYLDLYGGGVLFSDVVFEEIMELLKEEGIYDPALIILFSDHGEEFFEHGGYRHFELFREVLRVPLIFKFPGDWQGGRIINQTVECLDIFPTLADYLGLSAKLPPIQGQSLLPLIRGEPGYAGIPVSFSNCLKYIRFSADGYTYSNKPTQGVPEWLFAGDDIEESRNLAETEKETLQSMRERAGELMLETLAFRDKVARGEDDQAIESSPELIRQLRALGYVN